jgi:hypothetical protein
MSIFANTDGEERRTLFWLVCIIVRVLLATACTTFTYYGPEWVAYVVGAVACAGGIGFWVRRSRDNKPNIWWHRGFHGLVWLAGGTAILATRSFVAVAILFFGDVLLGIGTALLGKRNPWTNFEGLLSNETSGRRFISFKGASLFGTDDQAQHFLTWWSLVHLFSALVAGAAAFLLDRYIFEGDSLWVLCLVASFGIVLWEGFENTHLKLKADWFGESRIDSDANLFGDIVVGFAAMWGLAYTLRATVA